MLKTDLEYLSIGQTQKVNPSDTRYWSVNPNASKNYIELGKQSEIITPAQAPAPAISVATPASPLDNIDVNKIIGEKTPDITTSNVFASNADLIAKQRADYESREASKMEKLRLAEEEKKLAAREAIGLEFAQLIEEAEQYREDNMYKLLKLLDGKKALIGGVLNAVNCYLAAAGTIDQNLAALLSTIIMILTGAGVLATNRMLGNKHRYK
jgi:hypothetical protein